MSWKHLIRTAVQGLTTHKSRSMLTTLGIVIGIAAIILVMALGQGARALIVDQISSLGADTVVVQPGGKSGQFGSNFFANNITERDFKAITKKSNVPNLEDAMPEVVVSGAVSAGDQTYQETTLGGDAEFFANTFSVYPEEGALFTKEDIGSRARVALIGSEVASDLFGGSDPVGQSIRIKDEKFRVIGVFPKKGSFVFFNLDKMVLVPYTSAQTYLGDGSNHYTQIDVRADSPANVDKLVYDLTATMRDSHNIDPGKDDDFTINTQQNLVQQISTIVGIMTAFLTAVVAISLVVGGVGIMNIMLVSVTERTREIGLRKALGATRGDIVKQFLLEAVMLTGAGGVIGIAIGTLLAYGASLAIAAGFQPTWQFVFPWSAAIIGVIVSAGVGLVFGIYPALQASKKSPIEALRYE